jgi:hypothetical protein
MLEVARDLPRVRGVPRNIERMVLHMLLAACDALPLGGTVWLVVERESVRGVRIEVFDSGGARRDRTTSVEVLRTLAAGQLGDVRVVEHAGAASSLQVVVPAIVAAPN